MKKHVRLLALPFMFLCIASSAARGSSIFTVNSLVDTTNSGTLRWAITSANANPLNNGLSTITFSTNGTIYLSRPLPYIYKPVFIDGTSAPGYSGSPVVSIYFFNNCPGIRLASGSKGSTVKGLSLYGAKDAGISIQSSKVTVQANYISGGQTDGVSLLPGSSGNLIGGTSVSTGSTVWYATNFPITVNGWQGLRNYATNSSQTNSDWYLMAGTSKTNGLLYTGPMNGVGGNCYLVGYPSKNISSTSIYSAGNVTKGSNTIIFVGSYANTNNSNSILTPGFTNYGFVWTGTTNDLSVATNNSSPISTNGKFRTIDYSAPKKGHPTYNFCHSVMGDLAVGNVSYALKLATNSVPGPGIAYICKLTNADLSAPTSFVTIPTNALGAKSITAYGIWDNGNGSYTICGGFSTVPTNNITNQRVPLTGGLGYLVDFNPKTTNFTNWRSYSYPTGVNIDVHFEGISSTQKGVYTLVADLINGTNTFGCQVSVNRNSDGTFGNANWTTLTFPGVTNAGFVGADSVYGNQVVGFVTTNNNGSNVMQNFQMTISSGWSVANVIGGNSGNGVSVIGSLNNTIAQNIIGANIIGTNSFGGVNGGNGILLSQGSSFNMIGGQFVGSNNPTGSTGFTTPTFQRPPLGNLISGNGQNGVRIEGNSQSNVLSGNYIGTDSTGTNALGNGANGVDIENSIGNAILGCGYFQNPFAYYNVISGNYGHGVVINNANSTVFQGNYVGIDALDSTNVSNQGDGLLISGSSKFVQVGGVIPLGSVISGNWGHGTEIKDTVSCCTNFNTFGGLPSFKTNAVPNYGDGILITATGGSNTVRTCVMSGNLGNGVEIGGNASGVLVEDTTAGTETTIRQPLPNQCNGIAISGTAHGNRIGGYDPSIEMTVHASGNKGYGIVFLDGAYSNSVMNCRVGLGTVAAIPNTNGGIYFDEGTYGNLVGGSNPLSYNLIGFNNGDGITIMRSKKNQIMGNRISTNQVGIFATGNCSGTLIQVKDVTNNVINWETNSAIGVTYK